MSFLPSPQRPTLGPAAPRITGAGLVQGIPSIEQPD